MARFTQTVTRTAGASATVLLDSLLSDMSNWTRARTEGQDDITVLVVELTGSSQNVGTDLRNNLTAAGGNQRTR